MSGQDDLKWGEGKCTPLNRWLVSGTALAQPLRAPHHQLTHFGRQYFLGPFPVHRKQRRATDKGEEWVIAPPSPPCSGRLAHSKMPWTSALSTVRESSNTECKVQQLLIVGTILRAST